MSEARKEEVGWILSRIWLDALEETARDFHGNWPKMFCSRAYEHATDTWMKVMANEYDLVARPESGIAAAIGSYVDLGVEAGLFKSHSDFKIEALSPNKTAVTVFECPYRKTCMDLVESGFSMSDLTCARIGCFRAAVKSIAGIDCDYEVTRFSAEACDGFVERT